MIKYDLINSIVNRTGLSRVKGQLAAKIIIDMMTAAMQCGERIELRGFGVFDIRPRKTGIGRNLRTGEEVSIPKGKTVRFKPGKGMQNL